MINEQLLHERIDNYARIFDLVLDNPESAQAFASDEDPLLQYLCEAINEPSNRLHCEEDPVWREVFRSSLMSFLESMLKIFMPLEQKYDDEMHLRDSFLQASLQDKREHWQQVVSYLAEQYPMDELNTCGYLEQLQQTSEDEFEPIFQAFCDQWQMVAKAHLLIQLNKVLHRGKERFEMNADSQIAMDYQFILDYERISVRYPILKEIVDIMGRSLPKDKELKDTTITRYLPLLLSHTPVPTELDGVTMGNRLPDTLPSELVYLSDPQTEDIFFHRFATHTLQLMQSKPPSVSKEKTEHTTQAVPRLIKGPIIVSVDTSGSMQGRPIQIATALLMQLLQLARQQHRACYLITYSVRAHAIDLAHPGNWNRVQDFLRNGFSGGTDGNEMLQQACQQLHEKTYSMADVLIISDFQWSHPSPSTTSQMESEKKKGTRFYGLEIGPRFQTKSHPWLDKFWNIRIDHY